MDGLPRDEHNGSCRQAEMLTVEGPPAKSSTIRTMHEPHYHLPDEETLDRSGLDALQRRKLRAMLDVVTAGNAFYRRKLASVAFDASSDPIANLPFTTRAELEAD